MHLDIVQVEPDSHLSQLEESTWTQTPPPPTGGKDVQRCCGQLLAFVCVDGGHG